MKRPPIVNEIAPSVDEMSSDDDDEDGADEKQQVAVVKRNSGTIMNNSKFHHGSKGTLPSPLGSVNSFDQQVANWRMEKLEVESKSGSEEEFFDCQGKIQVQNFL